MIEISSTTHGVERAAPGDKLVRMLVNGKPEMLPADPFKTAAILAKRSKDKSPAAKAKARMAAAAKARGLG